MKQDEMSRTCSTNGGDENAYNILVGNPEEKNWGSIEMFLKTWVVGMWTGFNWLSMWSDSRLS